MKTSPFLTVLGTFLVFASASQARTWTSAKGDKTFQAEYVSSTSRSVTVIMKGDKKSFSINKLSAADQAWIKKEQQRDAAPYKKVVYRSIRDQKIGRMLLHQTFRVSGSRFVTAKINKTPSYYYLYYAASW